MSKEIPQIVVFLSSSLGIIFRCILYLILFLPPLSHFHSYKIGCIILALLIEAQLLIFMRVVKQNQTQKQNKNQKQMDPPIPILQIPEVIDPYKPPGIGRKKRQRSTQ